MPGQKLQTFRLGAVLIFCLLAGGLYLQYSLDAIAETPKAVTLLYFRGTGGDGSVLLEWATATEFDTAGFQLERSDDESGPFALLDQIGFIGAAGSYLSGATYSATDRDQLTNGQAYFYRLVELELSGTENLYGPIEVVPNINTSTPTSTSTATPTTPSILSSSSTNTPTPTSSPTPTPSRTPSPGFVSTPFTTLVDSTPDRSQTPDVISGGSEEAELEINTLNGDDDSMPVDLNPSANSNSELAFLDPALQGNPDETREPYPAPANEENAGDGGSYPGIEDRPADSAGINRPDRSGSSAPPEALIDSQISGQQEVQDQNREGSNTLFLWVGFLAALLIFVAGVLASIYYFDQERTRQ